MIYLAYDGSLNGDWVSRYALRFAAHSPEKKLHLIHVEDHSIPVDLLEKKILKIERESRSLEVDLAWQIRSLEKNVFHSLVKAIPPSDESYLVCGTRVRSKRQAYLSGTVSEKLLRYNKFHVFAVRVVQPGLLGNPHDLLIPLGGHPRGFQSAWPFFRLFLPHVGTVYLLRSMNVSSIRHPHLSLPQKQSLREAGFDYLEAVSEEIFQEKGAADFLLDNRVVICDDWAREVLVHASKLKVQMIMLGASERSFPHRVVHGNPLERVLRETPCDVGIYRGL